jgi:hypothetical protein
MLTSLVGAVAVLILKGHCIVGVFCGTALGVAFTMNAFIAHMFMRAPVLKEVLDWDRVDELLKAQGGS